jgi:hypothetical protein
MSFTSGDRNPEPSKGRAVLSVLTGMALLGSGSAAGIGMGHRYTDQKHAYTRSERIGTTVAMLLLYAGIGLGITIGWRQTHHSWGPWVGGFLGAFAGLMLPVMGIAHVAGRWRGRGRSG